MKIEDLIKKYEKIEHYVSPAGLIFGFVWHMIYLTRIDLLYDNLLLVFYLILTGMAIIYLNAYQIGRLSVAGSSKVKSLFSRFFEIISILIPFFLQFSIGGLFSSFLLFYGESGSLAVSWPFFATLVLLLVLNEFYYKRVYQVLIVQVCSYFAVIFLYLVFGFPILLKRLGDGMFLLSGAASLVIIFLFVLLLRLVAKKTFVQSRNWLIAGVGVIFIILNALYFANIIPPIPLSLKESSLAHSVARTSEGWLVEVEAKPWYRFYKNYNPVFHWQSGERVYIYAAVFAPTNIKTEVFHRWSFYDERSEKWVVKNTVSYQIVGGRDGGWRGYSYNRLGIEPGNWRVDVVNSRGQVLGRLSFKIVLTDAPTELEKIIFNK